MTNVRILSIICGALIGGAVFSLTSNVPATAFFTGAIIIGFGAINEMFHDRK